MRIDMFDVVKLNDNNKATILSVNNNLYNAEIANGNGKTIGIESITDKDIKEIIYKKSNKNK